MLEAGQEQKRVTNLSLHPEMPLQSLNSACRLSTSSDCVLVVQRGQAAEQRCPHGCSHRRAEVELPGSQSCSLGLAARFENRTTA